MSFYSFLKFVRYHWTHVTRDKTSKAGLVDYNRMLNADEQYQNLVKHVLRDGVEKSSRAGDVKGIFGHFMQFDLREGFPLLTTKKINFDYIYYELMAFIRGETLLDGFDKCRKLWEGNALEDGSLGPIYGAQYSRWETLSESVVLVQKQLPDFSIEQLPFFDLLPIDADDSFCGQIFTNNKYGDRYVVVRRKAAVGKNSQYVCQFLDETHAVVTASRPAIRSGQVANPYKKSIYGVGYLGESKHKHNRFVYDVWNAMLARCYNKNHPSYSVYGGAGVTVASRWFSFANFLQDIPKLPFYYSWHQNPSAFNLDKDYYGANQYGPNTCLFLDQRTNKGLNDYAIECDGKLFTTGTDCAEFLGIDQRRFSEMMNGIRPNLYKISKVQPPAGFVYRKKRVINQLAELVDKLKNTPNDRRMIVSAWNPAEFDQMCLPPCHLLFQCYVEPNTKELDLIMYQRSCDVAIGVPYNIASYALLMHLLAQSAGLKPRFLSITLADAHIYTQHLDAIREQISRTTFALPRLELLQNNDLFEYAKRDDVADIKLHEYQSHPFVKYEFCK